jgi:hypothetical protein
MFSFLFFVFECAHEGNKSKQASKKTSKQTKRQMKNIFVFL